MRAIIIAGVGSCFLKNGAHKCVYCGAIVIVFEKSARAVIVVNAGSCFIKDGAFCCIFPDL
jgi:hypothetical protein